MRARKGLWEEQEEPSVLLPHRQVLPQARLGVGVGTEGGLVHREQLRGNLGFCHIPSVTSLFLKRKDFTSALFSMNI